MQASIAYIRKELGEFYPKTEIDGFIRIIFSVLKSYNSTDLIIKKDENLNDDDRFQITKVIERLKRYEPIQYILGEADFFGLTFEVNEHVLIPRQETEELVDWILQQTTITNPSILDIGTGSGCIPISLKKYLPEAQVKGCDISAEALQTAKYNAESNQVYIDFFQLDILNPTLNETPSFDIIVSNPPYITEKEMELMHNNVLNHEPHTALFVPNQKPLLFYEALVDFGKKHLKNNGLLYWEINENFGQECVNLLHENKFQNVQLKKDINGKDRMISAQFFAH